MQHDDSSQVEHCTGRTLGGTGIEEAFQRQDAASQEGHGMAASIASAACGFYGEPPRFKRTHFTEIPSTQDYLRDHANALFIDTDWVVVTAECQTKGRGTQSRHWASQANANIYATYGMVLPSNPERVREMQQQPVITQIMAWAVIKTLREFGFDPKIKWRNDLRINGKKISGILCEPAPEQSPILDHQGRAIGLVGIGLNVNMEKSVCDALDQPVTSMAVEKGESFDKEHVFKRLSLHVSGLIRQYVEHGFGELIEGITKHFEGLGTTIQVRDKVDGKEYIGEFVGIDPIGCLRLKLEDDSERIISHGQMIKESLDPIHAAAASISKNMAT